jgi:hypothetical protein
MGTTTQGYKHKCTICGQRGLVVQRDLMLKKDPRYAMPLMYMKVQTLCINHIEAEYSYIIPNNGSEHRIRNWIRTKIWKHHRSPNVTSAISTE